MNVLLIGGAGNITNKILEKFSKEGDRIYVLTGSEVKLHSYNHVFEQYSFSYESPSIKEIFESVRPDVTIFMGAYDTHFNWENAREEAVRYSAGLLNILMGYTLVKSGQFLYLSSEVVYSQSYPETIFEDEPANAQDFRGMVIQQGEELCKNYQQFEGLDIVIMRLDHLCAVPKKREEATDACSKMCVEALKRGVVEANGRNKFSLLYISDAIEFLYQFIKKREHEHMLYHLSSSIEISALDLAQLVKAELGGNITVRDNSVGVEYKVVLNGSRFRDEFQVSILNSPERIVKQVVPYIKRHKNRFLETDDRGMGFLGRLSQSTRGIIKALIPFVENMVCFIPFFMLNNRAVGSEFFSKLDFYLLYVLLFAIVYGQQQATFSAILATAGYCFRQMYNRSGFDVMLDYNTYVWIAQLFILGLVVGYLRDQLSIIRKEDKDEIKYLSGQISDIQDINTSNVRIKNVLEEQIINHNQSVGKIYEITSELEQYAPEEVLFYAAEVIGRLMESKDVAIYSVANQQYARLFSATSDRARELGNSIRYDKMEDVYNDLIEKKVYINKNLKHEYPLMANAIYEEEQMQILIFIWGIPWERMNLGMANILKVVGYLIQNAVLRANRYQKALEDQRYMKGTRVLERSAFASLVRAYLTAQDKGLTCCSLLYLSEKVINVERTAEVQKVLRSTDYMGELVDDRWYVLLPNTDKAGAQKVIERFDTIGLSAVYQEDFEIE